MKRTAILILSLTRATAAWALDFGSAPKGEATMVAQKIILDNFEKNDCPLVVKANRLGDGSIRATCSNGEIFRVFNLQGKNLALRCSAAAQMGISGC